MLSLEKYYQNYQAYFGPSKVLNGLINNLDCMMPIMPKGHLSVVAETLETFRKSVNRS